MQGRKDLPVPTVPATLAPAYFPGYADNASRAELREGEAFSLSQLTWAIRRYAGRIGIFVMLWMIITAIVLYRMPKQYAATTLIRLDPTTPSASVHAQNIEGNSVGNMGAMLATDKDEILSPAVVIPTILHLGMLNQGVGKPSYTDVPIGLVNSVRGNITVKNPQGTYLLSITYSDRSPQKAADVANMLAQQFLLHEYQTRTSALLNLSNYMKDQLDSLRVRMEKSQLELNAFELANNIVNPQDTSSLLTQRLSSLQSNLEQAEAQQRTLQANMALVEIGNTDALAVSERGPALQPLLKSKQSAQLALDNLASKYGPGNYRYQQAERLLLLVNHTLDAERSHIAQQIEAQVHAQSVQVGLIKKQLSQAIAQLNQFNSKAVQFDILKHAADSNKTLYDALLQNLNAANIRAGYHSTPLRIVNTARPDPVPVSPKIRLTLSLSLVLSTLLGLIAVILLDSMDHTLRDPESVQHTLGEPLLGSLPQAENESDVLALFSPESKRSRRLSPFTEAIYNIRTTMMLHSGEGAHSIAITSSLPREGKSTIAANIAVSVAMLGKRLVLVDGDIRRPQAHQKFHLPNRYGLSSVLAGEISLEDALQSTTIPNLTVLTSGPSSSRPGELLALNFSKSLEELKERFEIIIIDTPPPVRLFRHPQYRHCCG